MRIPAALFAAALVFANDAASQSPLTTTYASNNGGAAGWTIYFDLQVNVPITITRIDVNHLGLPVAGSVDVHHKTGTYVGFDTNAAAWTLGSNGTCTGAPVNTPTVCTLAAPFVLAPGPHGIAVVHNVITPRYTDGNGNATPGSGTNQTYSNAELTLRAGAVANGGLGTAIAHAPRVFNGSIHYTVTPGYANHSSYGLGCYRRAGSFYEDFATAAAFDLGNTSVSLVFNGTGYTVQPGLVSFVAPGGSATVIANADDTEQIVNLASPLNHPGGSTAALAVCSNGFISTATGNGTSYNPTVSSFLSFPQTCWANWHDFNVLLGGSIRFEEIGSFSRITWLGVFDWLGGGNSTFQFQFDRATGNVHLVCQAMSTLGNTGFLTGFKASGPAIDPGNRDISATLAATFPAGADLLALALDCSARPVIGTTINLVTTQFPANSALGANILSFTRYNPGLDLTAIGMPGCRQFTGLDSNLIIIPSAGSASRSFGIPNNPAYAGIHVYSQSVAFAPGANPLGLTASNGLDLSVNVQ